MKFNMWFILFICFYYLNVVLSGMINTNELQAARAIRQTAGWIRQSALSYLSGHSQHSTHSKIHDLTEVAAKIVSLLWWMKEKTTKMFNWFHNNQHKIANIYA